MSKLVSGDSLGIRLHENGIFTESSFDDDNATDSDGSSRKPPAEAGSIDDLNQDVGLSNGKSLAIRVTKNVIALIGPDRGDKGQSFSKNDQQSLQAAIPHLRLALQMRLSNKRVTRALPHYMTLEALSFGAIICRIQGQIVYANSVAEELAAARTGIIFRPQNGFLSAIVPADAQKLGLLIQSACLLRGSGNMAPSDRDGVPTLILTVAALLDHPSIPAEPSHALVGISRVGKEPTFDASRLIELFRLSPAQASLALSLYEGKSFEEISVQRRVKVSTLRSHFDEVLNRTGATGLRDLTRLLGALPPLR